MNLVKKILILLLSLNLSLKVFSQSNACNSVYNFLKAKKCNPIQHQLITSSSNLLPYNISVEFPQKNIGVNHYSNPQNLFLFFLQEDVNNNTVFFKNLFDYCRNNSFDFNITFVFLYGENQQIEKDFMVYGLDSYLSSINTNEDSTAFYVELNQDKTSIISSSNGKSSPSWLIKNEHDIYKKHNFSTNLPFFYISHINKFTFNQNRPLNSFFEMEIPSIILNLSSSNNISDENSKLKTDILIESIEAFSSQINKNWDNHFLMLNLFGKYLLFSENHIVKILVFNVFIFLFFIIFLGFINKRLEKEAWLKIKKIWYVVPISFFITLISFFIGKGIMQLSFKNISESTTVFLLYELQIFISFIFINIYYLPQIFLNKKYEVHSIDYLIIITIIINQFIFLFYDISLFPLFVFELLFAFLSLKIKNNIVHIIIFVLIFIPFALYAHSILKYCNISQLSNFVMENKLQSIFISFILYPVYLIYFRILSFVSENFKTKKAVFIFGGTITSVFFIILFLIGLFGSKTYRKPETKSIVVTEKQSDEIRIEYSDKKVFNNISRTLKIYLPQNPCQCSVQILTENGTPLVYSSDSYELDNSNNAHFLIPYNPPSLLTFKYGTENIESQILVMCAVKENIFSELEKEEFSLYKKSITIKEDGN